METEIIQETKLLYDDVSQLLYCIMLGFQASELQKLDPEIQKHFAELKKSTREMLDEIQRTALRSQHLVFFTFGFLPAIHRWVKHCEDEFNIRTVIEINGLQDERLPKDLELALYLLCRDWIYQTSRHLTNKHVELSLIVTKEDKELRVFFHAPSQSTGEEWWCTNPLKNPYKWEAMKRYHRSFQVLLQESGVTIIASLDIH